MTLYLRFLYRFCKRLNDRVLLLLPRLIDEAVVERLFDISLFGFGMVDEFERIDHGFLTNLDSAVAIDRTREAQSLRSEVDGFLPLSTYRSAVLKEPFKPHRSVVAKRKMTLKLSPSDALAAPGFHLASAIFDFDCGIRD